MKNILLVLTLMSPTALLSAQEASKKILTERKHEIGIFSHINSMSSGSYGNMDMQGVQFKLWKNETIGFRVLAGYASYNNFSSPFSVKTLSDTVVERSTQTNIGLGTIGFGVEAQRRFYKRVYLYAAMELRGGYGRGTTDTVTVKRLVNPNNYYSEATNGGRALADMFYINLSPSIGAKLNFNRISFGVEVYGVNLGYQSISYGNGPTTGMGDFDMGNVSQRVFINFRF